MGKGLYKPLFPKNVHRRSLFSHIPRSLSRSPIIENKNKATSMNRLKYFWELQFSKSHSKCYVDVFY